MSPHQVNLERRPAPAATLMSPGNADGRACWLNPSESRNARSASGWIGGLLPLWISFRMAPVTLRTDSEAMKFTRVRAIQHWRNSLDTAISDGEERSLPPAVVYRHCHPARSSVASFHRTLICGSEGCMSPIVKSGESAATSRVPLQSGYFRHPQKGAPSLLLVLTVIGPPHAGQSGPAFESTCSVILAQFPSACAPCRCANLFQRPHPVFATPPASARCLSYPSRRRPGSGPRPSSRPCTRNARPAQAPPCTGPPRGL